MTPNSARLKVETLGCVLFGRSLEALDFDVLWEATLGTKPEEQSTQRDGVRRAQTTLNGLAVSLTQSSGRLELQMTGTLGNPPATLPHLSEGEKAAEQLAAYGSLLVDQCRSLTRLGLHGVMSTTFATREESIAFVRDKLPFLPITPGISKDLVFQTNETLKGEIELNRIVNWTASDLQGFKVEISSGVPVATLESIPLVRCSLDYNNSVEAVVPGGAELSSDKVKEVYRLLVDEWRKKIAEVVTP